MTIEENKAFIAQFWQVLKNKLQGQPSDLSPFFCDDVVWHLPQSTAGESSSSSHVGKPAVLAIFSGDVGSFYVPETIVFDFHSITAEEDRVHYHFTMSAKTPTGKDYCNQYQSLFKMKNGAISEVWEYFDTAYLFGLYNA